MRPTTLALLVLLAVLVAPRAAHADCTLFSAEGPACAGQTQKMQVDFTKLAATNEQMAKMLVDAQRAQAGTAVPTDCKMIKAVDPRFVSKMPVQTPDPNVKLPIRRVEVPSCAK
jgi:hypothetical protein